MPTTMTDSLRRLLQLKQGLGLDDRAVFRKRVEGVDQQTVRPHVRLNEAERRG